MVERLNGMPAAAGGGGAGDLALGLHHPGEAGRRDPERQRHRLAEHLARGVDGRHVAQDRRVELHVGERLPRPGQGDLAVRGAVGVVEGRLGRTPLGDPAQVLDRQRRGQPALLGRQRRLLELQQRREVVGASAAGASSGLLRWSRPVRSAVDESDGCGRPGRAGPRGCPTPGRAAAPAPARYRAPSPRPGRRAPAGRRGRRCSWQSSAFCAPPPTTWTRRRRVRTATRPPRRRGRRPRPGSPRSRGPSRPGRRARARVLGAATRRSGRHVARAAGSAGRLVSKTATGPATSAAAREQRARSTGSPRVPVPDRLAEQPQPITLCRKRTRAVDAALVGEVRRPARPRSGPARRSSRPTSAQVPQEMYAAPSAVSGTPTTADAVSWEPTVVTGTAGRADAGGDRRGAACRSSCRARPAVASSAPARPSRSSSSVSHSPVAHVEQPGRGGVRPLGAGLAGQPVGEQVGDQQQPVGLARAGGLGHQLVDGVERQELQAVAGVELRVADTTACTGRDARRCGSSR